MEPVVINGMFRSGTTLLWRILAADPRLKHVFCEPLHPDLPRQIERFDHYKEYEEFPQAMKKWSPQFHHDKIRLKSSDKYDTLEAYLNEIMRDGALIKFCRMNLRLGWLLAQLSPVIVINMVRDPRAVVYSHLKRSEKPIHARRVNWNNWFSADYFDLYSQVPEWSDYLRSKKRKLPYMKIMALWRVNVEQSIRDLQSSNGRSWINVRYEDLISQPVVTMERIYALWGEEPPSVVIENARGEATHDLGGHKKWQDPVNSKWISEWQAVDSSIWQEGCKAAGIELTMRWFGYIES